MTPQSLHLYLRRTAPRMGLATVYRTLELLAGCGLTERLVQPNSEVCYAYCPSQHHHHAICVRCGLTVEVAGCPLPDVQRSIERQTAFALSDHSLTFFGTCRMCQEAIATGRPPRRRVPRHASPAS